MTGQDKAKTCFGCAHRSVRIRGSIPRSWCSKYHCRTEERCIDYIFKPKAVELALRFVKRLGAGLK